MGHRRELCAAQKAAVHPVSYAASLAAAGEQCVRDPPIHPALFHTRVQLVVLQDRVEREHRSKIAAPKPIPYYIA